MGPELRHDIGLVRESTDQLVHDVGLLSDEALAGPSLLPGWSRAEVVGHLIGNAEGLTRLLEWARTGIRTPQYFDQEGKDEGIASAIGQPARTLASRVRDASDEFVAVAETLTGADWTMRVRLGVNAGGRELPASELPWRRLVEQEVHNVDLDGAYTPAHWSDEFVHRLLDETARHFLPGEDVPPLDLQAVDGDWSADCGPTDIRTRIEGPSPALLAWLTGRSDGEGLHVSPPPLPDLPPWF
mgnify:CR=1 FL=1